MKRTVSNPSMSYLLLLRSFTKDSLLLTYERSGVVVGGEEEHEESRLKSSLVVSIPVALVCVVFLTIRQIK